MGFLSYLHPILYSIEYLKTKKIENFSNFILKYHCVQLRRTDFKLSGQKKFHINNNKTQGNVNFWGANNVYEIDKLRKETAM